MLTGIVMQVNHNIQTVKSYATVGLVFYGLATCIATFALDISWVFLVSVGLTIWAYITYKKIDEGNYADARTYSLVLGILGLFPLFGSFIGGIFFLLAYGKLGDVLRIIQVTSYPTTLTHVSNRICVECGRLVGIEGHFCSHCGAKLPE